MVRLILFYFYVAVGPASRPMSFLHERYLVALEFLLRIKRLLANVTDVSTTRIFTHWQSPNYVIEFRLSRVPYT